MSYSIGKAGITAYSLFDPDIEYPALSFVLGSDGNGYTSFVAVPAGNPPPDAAYWRLSSLRGEAGHTPARGVDYWTTADQTTIIAQIESIVSDAVADIMGGAY